MFSTTQQAQEHIERFGTTNLKIKITDNHIILI